MSEPIMTMRYEFFSTWGAVAGAVTIALVMTVESLVSFPAVWQERAVEYTLLIVVSAVTVGVASGAVLVYLFPPDQDVIGIAGLGSDDATQNLSLFLVILALIQPTLSTYVFFFQYLETDPFAIFWVIFSFLAPSIGLTVAMFDRANRIADDLEDYFRSHDVLDLTTLSWLKSVGARTATYRMGMLESAVRRVSGLSIVGHEVVRTEKE